MKYDPRYESARATNQSERGWDFRPAPKSSGNIRAFLFFVAFLAVILAAWIITGATA